MSISTLVRGSLVVPAALMLVSIVSACDPPAKNDPAKPMAAGDEAGAMAPTTSNGQAGDINTMRAVYKKDLEGKTVAFLPIAMGFDLTEGWAAVLKQQAREHGFKLVIKDPNWSSDAQVEALTALIADKPDLLIVHNNNLQLLVKLLQKAEQAGIRVIQINMPSAYQTEAYVGVDWIQIGEVTATQMIADCSKKTGHTGKVAIIQGQITDPASIYQLQGFNSVLKAHDGDLEVVSTQASEWDATKSKAISESLVQQHKDLCGVYGFWDGMMKGSGEVFKNAGGKEPIKVYTSGGGGTPDCTGIKDGLFTHVWAYNVPDQGRDISDVMKILLQTTSKPGAMHVSLFTPLTHLDKTTAASVGCWDLAELKARTAGGT